MSGPSVYQALMTRFNIRSSGAGYRRDQDPLWLERRLALFDQFCAPSVVAQTEEQFDWLIFCDLETSAEVLERLQSVDPRIRTVLVRPAAKPPELQVHHYLPCGKGTDIVVSSRLDNDDAISRHALRRVRDHVDMFLATAHERWLYNPLLGFKLNLATEQLYEAQHKSNPFLTLFERISPDSPPEGAFARPHGYMHSMFPTFQDTGARLWLQIVHGDNVSNSIREQDAEVALSALGSDFVVAT